MSLINQMLKDLEHRQASLIKKQKMFSDLIAPTLEYMRSKRYWLIAICIGLLAMFISFTYSYFITQTKTNTAQPTLPLRQETIIETPTPDPLINVDAPEELPLEISDIPATTPLISTLATDTQIEIDPKQTVTEEPTPILLEDILVDTEELETQIILQLSEQTTYTVDNDNNGLLTITLDNIKMTEDFPLPDFTDSLVVAFEEQISENTLIITLALQPDVTLQLIEFADAGEAGSTELVIELLKDLPEPTLTLADKEDEDIEEKVQEQVLEKVEVQLSPLELAEQNYKEAMDFVGQGRYQPAIVDLEQALEHFPSHQASREALAALLIEQGELDKARNVLQEGLEQYPRHAQFAKLMARLLLEQNKPEQALELLERAIPPATDVPDYHAFMAALYQRLGKSELAIQTYHTILQVNPYNATWWMGLGISLKGVKQFGSAREAFQKAKEIGGLEPQLLHYINSEIRQLQG